MYSHTCQGRCYCTQMEANGVVRSPVAVQKFYDISARTIAGHEYHLEKYRGKVVVIVNIASFGTDASKVLHQMNDLQSKYSSSVAVLGFPCNQFNHSEHSDGEEILNTMRWIRPGDDFYPAFDLFDKVEVNGANAHPLFKYLRETLPLPSDDLHTFADSPIDITWAPVCRNDVCNNFEKFIVAPNGKPYRRYSPKIQIVNLQNDIKHLLSLFGSNRS